jgi:hypothetical protein
MSENHRLNCCHGLYYMVSVWAVVYWQYSGPPHSSIPSQIQSVPAAFLCCASRQVSCCQQYVEGKDKQGQATTRNFFLSQDKSLSMLRVLPVHNFA